MFKNLFKHSGGTQGRGCPFAKLSKLLSNKESVTDRTPVRPLGAVSDFVVEEMPALLAQTENGGETGMLATRLMAVAQQIDLKNLESSDEKKLGLLDVKLLRIAAHQIGAREVMDVIDIHIEQVSHDPVYSLTYEDIILSNPASDPRHMGMKSGPEVGFYIGHQMIEQSLIEVSQLVFEGITGNDEDLLANNLYKSAEIYKTSINNVMQSYRRDLSTEDFNAIRPYFSGDEDKEEPGPSGAFTGQVPLMDRLMFGNDSSLLDHFKDNQRYFPEAEVNKFKEIGGEFSSVQAIAEKSSNNMLKGGYNALVEQMTAFRSYHYASVSKHIPKKSSGTGGVNDAHIYLTDRIKDTKKNAIPVVG